MLRAAGITMTPSTGHDRIRQIAATLAESIEHRAEVKSVEVARKLQEGVKKAFEAMEKDLEKNYAKKPKKKAKSPYDAGISHTKGPGKP
jgi:hypothetical protein